MSFFLNSRLFDSRSPRVTRPSKVQPQRPAKKASSAPKPPVAAKPTPATASPPPSTLPIVMPTADPVPVKKPTKRPPRTVHGKVLVLGASGQLGSELTPMLGDNGIAKSREGFDLSNVTQIRNWLPVLRPDVLINCASVTNLIETESRHRGWEINTIAAHEVAKVCAQHGFPLIHFSTSHVFSSHPNRTRSYLEDDTPCPGSVFGAQKLASELAIMRVMQEAGVPYWILRVSNLFEKPWRTYTNFAQQILTYAGRNVPCTVRVPADAVSSWTYVPHLAQAVLHLVQHRNTFPSGVYHVTNRGSASYHDFADRILRKFNTKAKLEPLSAVDYCHSQKLPTSLFPRYTVLNTDKFDQASAYELPSWEEAIESFCSLL